MSPLSDKETIDLTERLAELTSSGLPLPDGLRAAAEDAASRRLANVFRGLANELDSGNKLEEALVKPACRLPAYLQGAVRAGIFSGDLPSVLFRVVQADHQRQRVTRDMRLALAYPIALLAIVMAFLLVVAVVVLPEMESLFVDFDTELPPLTLAVLGMGKFIRLVCGSTLCQALGGVVLAVCLANAVLKPRVWWMVFPSRWLTALPLLGPLFLWRNVGEWARLLAVLLDARVPLPEALRLSSQGMRSVSMAKLSADFSKRVEQGASLSQLIEQSLWIPKALVPIVQWGEKSNQLAEALRKGATALESRVELRAVFVKQVAPPVMFCFVGSQILLITGAVLMPLVSLIQNLSG